MSLLNINSVIYETIKNESIKNCRQIGNQASYWIMIGKFFCDNPNDKFENISKKSFDFIKNKKVTG